MTTMQPRNLDTNPDDSAQQDGETDDQEAHKPLTANQAKAWRATQPNISPWLMLLWQALALVLLGLLTAWWLGDAQAKSFVYGGVAVLVPAALMVVGLSGGLMRRLSAHPSGSLVGFALLESLKLLLSVLLMLAAPQLVSNLSWLALLAGVVVALKVHWLVFGLITMRAKRIV